mmetsp:Transcript_42237/g.128133  ORF Transcript_42237/g.128133 Transcript_42237/m.128133 type:complete len:111 (+) Transcript_42237:783-1115(+)
MKCRLNARTDFQTNSVAQFLEVIENGNDTTQYLHKVLKQEMTNEVGNDSPSDFPDCRCNYPSFDTKCHPSSSFYWRSYSDQDFPKSEEHGIYHKAGRAKITDSVKFCNQQ